MKIGIPLSHHAYTPEAYAYEKYLKKIGCQVQLDYELDPNNDVNIYFMGVRPFWRKNIGRAKEIHEYQSLSTPPYAKFKNCAKKTINKSPSGRIFLNDFVYRDLNFNDDIPFFYRDMGVDKAFYQYPLENPDFDITYCGSVDGRIGLLEEIIRLSLLGFKIQVIGSVSSGKLEILKKYKNIKIWGRVDRECIPELYRNSRCGLNFTPNLYPFNMQTSTKVLEYAASNLIILSNRYKWIHDFSNKKSINTIWLDEIDRYDSFLKKDNSILTGDDLIDLEWDKMLDNSGLYYFLQTVLSK